MRCSTLPLIAGLAVGLWLADSHSLQAQGTIRYVPNVNMTFPDGDTLWDPNGDGLADFVFRFDGRSLGVFPQVGSQILAFPPTPPDLGGDVAPLTAPSEIGDFDYSPIGWIGFDGVLGFPGRAYFNSCTDQGCVGTFVGTQAYFGFSVENQGQVHYGWAFFNVSWGGPGGILEEYAYNLVPGESIFVGQVPEPGTWALLTFGAGLFGWRIWRRKQRA